MEAIEKTEFAFTSTSANFLWKLKLVMKDQKKNSRKGQNRKETVKQAHVCTSSKLVLSNCCVQGIVGTKGL
jgi:hypothetical protein